METLRTESLHFLCQRKLIPHRPGEICLPHGYLQETKLIHGALRAFRQSRKVIVQLVDEFHGLFVLQGLVRNR